MGDGTYPAQIAAAENAKVPEERNVLPWGLRNLHHSWNK